MVAKGREVLLKRSRRGKGIGSFEDTLKLRGIEAVTRGRVRTLQINVGRRCNQTCHHCHVDAGPHRTEMMDEKVARRVIDLIASHPELEVVDITGGAPELNPNFRLLVKEALGLGREVIDRCNLTVLLEPGQEDLSEFLADHEVRIVASLPCYQAANVDRQRGEGVFEKSIKALRLLNSIGYGLPCSSKRLDLFFNPLGPTLPPEQTCLEAQYKEQLREKFQVEFHKLLTITNMPIRRFASVLERTNEQDAYLGLLIDNFNPSTVEGLMCRTLVSVGYDGRLYDCDFNQMLGIDLSAGGSTEPWTIFSVDTLDTLCGEPVTTGIHCFGCSAGSGASCSGAIQPRESDEVDTGTFGTALGRGAMAGSPAKMEDEGVETNQ